MMPEYIRTIDCEIWAKQMIDNRGINQNTLYKIEPSPVLVGATSLDDFHIVENGNLIAVEIEWAHHFAVLHEGMFYDENYPDGIDEDEYRDRAVNDRFNIIRPSNQTWIRGEHQETGRGENGIT
jgi:hypothetical protein